MSLMGLRCRACDKALKEEELYFYDERDGFCDKCDRMTEKYFDDYFSWDKARTNDQEEDEDA